MKKITAFLTALLALIINPKANAQNNNSNSLLWRVSGKNLAKPSYLFGTIHMICSSDYLWTDKMKQTLAASDKICFEMDLDDQAVMMQVAMGLMDNTGKTLSSYFTPEEYARLKKYMHDSLQTDISMFEKMKPAALQTLLIKGSATCDDPVSYEETIMKTATKEKKEIIGLETPQEQIAVLESLPADSVVKQIMEVVDGKGGNGAEDEFGKMVAAYKKQDLQALYTLITQATEVSGEMNLFLDDRNKRWIERMPASMSKSSIFFAVGAGHLWGPNGVINLLKKEGYEVTPIK